KCQLERAGRHLEKDQYYQAVKALEFFRLRVDRLASQGRISSWSAAKLTFLADEFMQSFGVPLAKDEAMGEGQTRPWGFQLHQNYPNPFNPDTRISYSLPADSDVRLTVFNVLGQEVKVLVQGYKTSGSHSVTWDGRNEDGENVSSGIYFYKLEAGEFAQTKKMSLMK
ncbi:MAG: T9SS type A sorting domain-containing protein, partial [Anaerolineae bacterium]|nr:T9SS type A sorting domain-containing protein [Anaerolineae bacterium]